MSTRSAIIMKTHDGSYVGIYCHYDGYEDGVGQTLLDHYGGDPKTAADKVAALIALGDVSSLRERVAPVASHHSYASPEDGTTVAYHRDRGEAWEQVAPTTGATAEEVASQLGHNGYVYVFEAGKWTCCGKPPIDGKFVDCYSSTFGR